MNGDYDSRERSSRSGKGLWQGLVVRSGMVTMTVLVLALLVGAFVWREHTKGQFGRLKRGLKGEDSVATPVLPLPGGQEPVVLERSPLEGGTVPEFLTATFLPGRGMGLLQLKANIPGKGEVNLLDGPSLTEAETLMTGEDEDASGAESLKLGAVLEVPWAGSIYGSPKGDSEITTTWEGHTLNLPAVRRRASLEAAGGLLLKTASKSSQMNVMPDGGETAVTYSTGGFDGRWPSEMEVTTTAQLSGHSFELKILARNTGDEATPVGIGWEPRFAVLGEHRNNLLLYLSSISRLERNAHTGEPTGKLIPIAGTPYDFSTRSGVPIDGSDLDETFVGLRQAPLDNGPVVELRDPGADYGLRLTLLSSTIKAVHVTAPRAGHYVTLAPRFNYDDPFGREWGHGTDTGMVVLKPGESTQWRIRVEIFSLSSKKF